MTTVTITENPAAAAAGFMYDLSLTWIDVYGCRWTWTGERDATGMALMQTGTDAPERLSHVYWMSGPLTPASRPVTNADRYAAFTALPCTGPAEHDKPTSTSHTLAGVLERLRGRSA
ncbi:phiSA1p31-related protein [Streptomyces brevispora]|uniref:phiSA1p31-related protein n=1 Tax=Streptomyces brevispora TaxID=887462 RepID=UPI002E35EF2B|nr:phiSA1p31-related protein [Streptomyces brevispora]